MPQTGQPFQPLDLLDPAEHESLVRGFRDGLPLGPGLEPRLRRVLADTLDHPGSLVRAQLAYAVLVGLGGTPPRGRSLGVALEYFHTASLLFDDLPAMDDARERRGRPCPHLAHGEAAAMLAALGLVNQGYALLWDVLGGLPPPRRRAAAGLVARCLGVGGLLDGQSRDLHFAGGAGGEDAVLRVAEGKTVPLIRLTLVLPALVAGADAATRRRLEELARAWGLAYQVMDDFKDLLLSGAEAGKSTSRDALLDRPNLPRRIGPGRAGERLDGLLADAGEALEGIAPGRHADVLGRLQRFLERARDELLRRVPRDPASPAWASCA